MGHGEVCVSTNRPGALPQWTTSVVFVWGSSLHCPGLWGPPLHHQKRPHYESNQNDCGLDCRVPLRPEHGHKGRERGAMKARVGWGERWMERIVMDKIGRGKKERHRKWSHRKRRRKWNQGETELNSQRRRLNWKKSLDILSPFLISWPLFPWKPHTAWSLCSCQFWSKLFIQSELIPALAELSDSISQTRAFHPEKYCRCYYHTGRDNKLWQRHRLN